MFRKIFNYLKGNTIDSSSNSELIRGLILAPLLETLIFCYLPYKLFFLSTQRFWEIGIGSAFIFSLIHLRFGKYFLPVTFILGLFFWTIMVYSGFWQVVLAHFLVVLFDLTSGFRKFLHKVSS